MRKLLAIILWLIAIALWMQNHQTLTNQLNIPAPYQSLYEEVLMPVVKITTPQGVGSGVIISDTYILTAAHVVGNEKEVTVYIYEYESLPDKSGNYSSCLIYEANVVITDTVKDLALLHTPNPSQEGNNSPLKRGGWGCVAKLAPRNYKPYLFTEIWAVGCSLGLDPRPSSGHITAITTPFNPPLLRGTQGVVWEISAPILPGNSGGGVFLKDTHELIGIAVWVRVYHGQLITTMAGIVPLNQIYEFLEDQNIRVSEYQTTLSVNSEEDKRWGLTCWSDRGSDGAIGTGGPAGQPYL